MAQITTVFYLISAEAKIRKLPSHLFLCTNFYFEEVTRTVNLINIFPRNWESFVISAGNTKNLSPGVSEMWPGVYSIVLAE